MIESITTNPVYITLNCCRKYAYLRDKHVFSKNEGVHWAVHVLPVDFHDTVTTALMKYRSNMVASYSQ
jgi:aminoglycoside adenylyltransferase-like protein